METAKEALQRVTSRLLSEGAEPIVGMPADDGRSYVGHECTLDGVPATIMGRLNDFGTVAALPHGARFEYAWPTIARIMQRDRSFKS